MVGCTIFLLIGLSRVATRAEEDRRLDRYQRRISDMSQLGYERGLRSADNLEQLRELIRKDMYTPREQQ
jgi:hypothetical protein